MTKWIAVLPVCAWLHRIMVKTIPYLIYAHSLTREGVSVAGIRDSLTAIGMNSVTFDEYANQHWYIGRLLRKFLKLPMTIFESKSIGDDQQRLSDHSRLQLFMTGSTLETLFSLLSVPLYMAIIIFYSSLVLAVFLGFTLIFEQK